MDKLRYPESFQKPQIIKEYFSGMGARARNELLRNLNRNTNGSIEQFNDVAFELHLRMEEEKKKDLPKLLKSIVLNTLGYEANEVIEKTIYVDYQNPHIKRHGKPFVNGQYKIFRNEHENLLESTEEQTAATLRDFDKVIDLIVKHTLLKTINLKDMYIALDKNPKAIQGIVKKVLA